MSTAHALTKGFDLYWYHIERRMPPSNPNTFPENMEDLQAMLSDAYHDGWRDAETHHAKAIGYFETHQLG